MPIKHSQGSTMITGDSIQFFRLAALRGAMSLEIAGIKVRRGPVLWKQLKAEFGLTQCKNKQAVYDWLCAEVARLRPLQEHQMEKDGRVIREVEGQEIQ